MGLDYTLQVITEGGASSVWPGGCSVPPRSYHLSADRIGTLAKAGPLPSQSQERQLSTPYPRGWQGGL